MSDSWLRDRHRDNDEMLWAAFQNSDAYLDAYTDYSDTFDESPQAEKAFQKWLAAFEDDDYEPEPDTDLYDPRFFDDLVDESYGGH